MPRECPSSSLPITVLAFLAAVAVACFASTLEARSDEAYVCEGGRVAYVRLGELDEKIRSDPCIAAHYAKGKRAQGAVPPPTVVAGAGASAGTGAVATIPPLPERRPPGAAGEIIVVNEPAPKPQDMLTPKVEQVVFRHATRAVRQTADSAAPAEPADFRRIPIINASPGSPAVFHHTR